MPDDPNKRMDELLRAYAEERRKAPDMQLHPATRELLQGEVRRAFGSTAQVRPWRQRLRAFWPQIAFGSSLCVILGIAVLSLRQPNREQEKAVETPAPYDSAPTTSETESLISRDESPVIEQQKIRGDLAVERQQRGIAPEKKLKADAAAGAQQDGRSYEASAPEGSRLLDREQDLNKEPTPAPTLGRAKALADAPAELKQERLADSLAAPVAPPTGPQTETGLALEKRAVQPNLTSRPSLSPQAPAREESNLSVIDSRAQAPNTPALATAEKLSRAGELNNLGAARRLNFVQVSNSNETKASTRIAAAGAKAAPQQQTTLLSNFRVEQLGNNVQFFDNDGSVYVGSIEPTNATISFAGEELKENQPRLLNESTTYFFRAAGRNRTLGKDIVLTGNYFAQTNTGPTALDTFAISPEARAQQQAQPRHLIIGNATVGGSNQVPLQAVATEP